MSESSPAEFLTDRETADLLRVTIRTMMRWRRDGNGPPYTRAGRRLLYSRREIDAWAAGRTFAHRAAEAVSAAHVAR